jgi:AmmeMemoRadiSam system protein B
MPRTKAAAIVPHAGWYYSGLTAAAAISVLDSEAETVAVIGGHLPPGMPVLLAEEDGVKTPLGLMKIDGELREQFIKRISTRPDRYQDNTVEVLLPMVHYFFPRAQLLWARFPAELASFEAGKVLAETAWALGRRIAVLSSTDLTHYGENYGFSPRGKGKAALEWVKTVNDAAFINAVLEGNPQLVLKRAVEDFSACSAGAVLGGMGFVSSRGKIRAVLLDYRTSAAAAEDKTPASFVGYAAISLASD